MRRALDWMFRDRRTHEVVVAQWPNVALWVWIVSRLVRLGFHPEGVQGDVLSLVSTAALGWWSLDEIVRGVNPFRRIVGCAVLGALIAGLLIS